MAKIVGFVCLIILASIGVGISGGVPIPKIRNKKDNEKDKVELMEQKEDEDEKR
jgi:hypothetical protein